MWGVPLNLVMAAEIINDAKKSTQFDKHKDLYTIFIDTSISKTQVEKLSRNAQDARQQYSLRKEALECRRLLYKLAINSLFNSGKCGDELEGEEKDFLNRFPLATVFGKRVFFMHQTYAEYLMAEVVVLLMYQQPQAKSIALTEDQCLQILLEAEFAGVRMFMDKILSHTDFPNAVMKKVYEADFRVIDAMLKEYIISDLFHLYKALSVVEKITPEQINCEKPLGGPFQLALEHSTKREFLELLQAQGAEIDASNFDFLFKPKTSHFLEQGKQSTNTWNDMKQLDDELSSKTPLMRAAMIGNCEMALYLIKKGANANFACPETGATALLYAIKYKRTSMVQLLLDHGVKVTADDLCTAAEKNQLEMVHKWSEFIEVDCRNRFNRTALMEASDKCHGAIVEFLKSKKADPLASDDEGWTSLHFAAKKRRVKFMHILLIDVTNVDPRTKT